MEGKGGANASSGLSPLRYSVFRAIWLAAVVSNIGGMMQAVGEAWLMTSLVASSLVVALAWASDSLSIVALALPAGALADILNRRLLLVISQSWMLAIALIMGAITMAGLVSATNLLVFIFLLGLGEAISTPAFSPFLIGTVPRSEIRNAITLNGVALNVGRGIGPAAGGLLVALVSPAAVFFLNALSFAGIVAVLLSTRQRKSSATGGKQQIGTAGAKTTVQQQPLPAERMLGAVRVGLRYVRNSPSMHFIFVRVIVFAISASALPALLPTFSRHVLGLDAIGYGVLFALFGAGAIVGGLVIVPRAINRASSPDRLIVLATGVFSASLVVLGTVQNPIVLGAAMVAAGISQLMAYSSLSFALYRMLPNWVMSRVSSVYQLVLQAAIVGGSVLWGAAADVMGIKIALIIAGTALALGLIAKLKFPLPTGNKVVDVTPSMHYPSPLLVQEPSDLDQGPVLVQVEYRIDPSRQKEFADAMEGVKTIRKRDGAFFWGLFRHDRYPDVYVEAFLVDSWAEHLRQHERVTVADREIENYAFSFHIGEKPPAVSHFIASPMNNDKAENADA